MYMHDGLQVGAIPMTHDTRGLPTLCQGHMRIKSLVTLNQSQLKIASSTMARTKLLGKTKSFLQCVIPYFQRTALNCGDVANMPCHLPTLHHFPLFSGLSLKKNFWKSATVSINNPITKNTAPMMSITVNESWQSGVTLTEHSVGLRWVALAGALINITGRLTENTHIACNQKFQLYTTCNKPWLAFSWQVSALCWEQEMSDDSSFVGLLSTPCSGNWHSHKT